MRTLIAKGIVMLEFVRNNFRKWYAVLLWIVLIACILGGIIGGGIIGKASGGYYSNGHPILGGFIGLLLGTLIGLFIVIIGGGLVTTFLNIDENIQEIKNKVNLERLNSSGDGLNSNLSSIFKKI
jgi:hypothetical protein